MRRFLFQQIQDGKERSLESFIVSKQAIACAAIYRSPALAKMAVGVAYFCRSFAEGSLATGTKPRRTAALMSHSREDLAATLRSLLRGTASALRALTWYPRASSLHSPEETFILPYDMLDDVQLRSWELESNVRRKPFMRDALYPVASFLMLPKQGVRLLGVKQTSTSCWSSVLDFLLSRYSHALCHCQILRRRPSSSTSISSDTVSRGVG